MAKKTTNTIEKTDEKIKKESVNKTKKTTTNNTTNNNEFDESTPEEISFENEQDSKLDKLLECIYRIEDKLKNLLSVKEGEIDDLTSMNNSELYHLKTMLGENIVKNNYEGGDNELKMSSNNLIIKINEEIKNRIKKYQ